MNSYILTSSSTISINGTVYTYYGTDNSSLISHPYRFNNESASPKNVYTDDVISNSVQCWDRALSFGTSIGFATTNCNIYAYSVATLDEASFIGRGTSGITGGNKCIVSGVVNTYNCKIVNRSSENYDLTSHCVNYIDLDKNQSGPDEYTYKIDLYPYESVQRVGIVNFTVYVLKTYWLGGQEPTGISNSFPGVSIATNNGPQANPPGYQLSLLGHLRDWSETNSNIGPENETNPAIAVFAMHFSIEKCATAGSTAKFTHSWTVYHEDGVGTGRLTTNGSCDMVPNSGAKILISPVERFNTAKHYIADEYASDKVITIQRTNATSDGKTINFVFTLKDEGLPHDSGGGGGGVVIGTND